MGSASGKAHNLYRSMIANPLRLDDAAVENVRCERHGD